MTRIFVDGQCIIRTVQGTTGGRGKLGDNMYTMYSYYIQYIMLILTIYIFLEFRVIFPRIETKPVKY